MFETKRLSQGVRMTAIKQLLETRLSSAEVSLLTAELEMEEDIYVGNFAYRYIKSLSKSKLPQNTLSWESPLWIQSNSRKNIKYCKESMFVFFCGVLQISVLHHRALHTACQVRRSQFSSEQSTSHRPVQRYAKHKYGWILQWLLNHLINSGFLSNSEDLLAGAAAQVFIMAVDNGRIPQEIILSTRVMAIEKVASLFEVWRDAPSDAWQWSLSI